MTLEQIKTFREKEIEYCLNDPVYFVEEYGHIEDKDAAELIQPFTLWDEQKQALLSLHKNRLNVVMKARQLGFTWLAIHYVIYTILLMTGRTAIGLSRTEDEAAELIRRAAVVLRHMKAFAREDNDVPVGWTGAVFKVNAMKLTITFPNGPESVFKVFPSSPNAARSFTADILLFDEWAFQQFAREIWTSAFPVINRPNGGKVIGVSTIDRGSLFEDIFTDESNEFNKIFIPWYADPKRTQEWYDRTKRTMGELITQEYPATIEEALTVPGGSYFPEVSKDTHISKEEFNGSVRNYVCLDYGLDMLAAYWIHVDQRGHAQVYREYCAPDKTIGAACDILIGLTGDEKIELWLAPPDLWNRSQESGKSRAILFSENGINLTKTNNDFAAGCSSMKEWLKPQAEGLARLTILQDCASNLFRCLRKIQRDKKRPNVYAKEPHDLTHSPDALRCFCIWWTLAADFDIGGNRKKWTADMWEDYNNASDTDKQYLIKKYGEPV